ncbi:MAG: TerC family protein [Pseudomonadota bacterium]|nr:TerC family protein [Pseudomonadota bacterium]
MELLGVGTPTMWAGFLSFVVFMLALDLGVFHRKSHAVTMREALAWSAVWVACSFGFAGLVHYWFGWETAVEFVTGYAIEKSLAIDNIFVFVAVFGAFAVPAALQHRVLFWGVLGALVLRALFIFAGSAILLRFHWVLYVFGAFLLLTGLKMLYLRNAPEEDVTQNRLLTLLRRWIPSTDGYRGDAFFVVEAGRRLATPLFFVLVLIEVADVVFAVDSIPAIFAVTTDPFIVFTSNIFAILGLRSMYFLLADIVPRFVYLKPGLALVLVFVGVKMSIAEWYKIPTLVSLGVIGVLVGGAIVASLVTFKPAVAPSPRQP